MGTAASTTIAPDTKRIMAVISSPLGEHSCSNAIVKSFVDAYVAAHPGVEVDVCDCSSLPPFTAARIQSKFKLYGGADKADEDPEWTASKELIERFKSAEALVIGAPVWNFDIPAPLKLFFDHIVQPNKTFDPATYAGLVTGKPCFIARTAAGTAPESPMDSGSAYLKLILGLMGFTHVEILGMVNADPSAKDALLKAKCEEAAAKAATFAFDPAAKLEPPKAPELAPATPGAPLAPNSKVLYIASSPMGDNSASRKVCDPLIADIKAGVEGVTVTTLDLAAMAADGSLEAYTAKRVMAKFATFGAGSALSSGETMTSAGLDEASAAEWAFTQGLIKQFSEHDVYIFGVPMWNLGIPFHLKAYLDHIIQPHSTFDPATYSGLLKDKRAIVVATAGGPSLNSPLDATTSYMKQALGFMGVQDVAMVTVNGTASPSAANAIAAGVVEAKSAAGFVSPPILVLGSSGSVGVATLGSLASSGVSATAGVRDPSPASAKNAKLVAMEGVALAQADMSKPETLEPAISEGSTVFVATPGHIDRTELTLAAVKAAVASKAGHIVVVSTLSVCVSSKKTIFGEQFKPIEEAVKACGIPFTIVRLPMFMDNNLGQPIKEASAMFMPVNADLEMAAICTADIGEAIANVLKAPSKYAGRTLTLGGVVTTYAKTAAEYSKVLGKPVAFTEVPLQAAKESMLGAGWLEWQVDGVLELLALGNEKDSSGILPAPGEDNTVEVLGRPATAEAAFMEAFKGMFEVAAESTTAASEASTETVKLTYLNGRGVAESSRIMLSVAKVPFEDFRYPLDPSTFAKPEFDAAKASGALTLGMGRLPLLEVNGVGITESKAIDRYIACRYGFFGDTDIEGAHVDMIAEHVADIKKSFGDAGSGKSGDELKAAKSEWMKVKLAEWASKLETCLGIVGGTGGFAVGSKLSYADVCLYGLVCESFGDKDASAAAVASCPRISASVDQVKSAAAEWLASRPVTAL